MVIELFPNMGLRENMANSVQQLDVRINGQMIPDELMEEAIAVHREAVIHLEMDEIQAPDFIKVIKLLNRIITFYENQSRQQFINDYNLHPIHLPKNELRDGHYYYGYSRCAEIGMWDDRLQRFRTYKMEWQWIEHLIPHWDEREARYDAFIPFSILGATITPEQKQTLANVYLWS